MPLRKTILLLFMAAACSAEVWMLAGSGETLRIASRQSPCDGVGVLEARDG